MQAKISAALLALLALTAPGRADETWTSAVLATPALTTPGPTDIFAIIHGSATNRTTYAQLFNNPVMTGTLGLTVPSGTTQGLNESMTVTGTVSASSYYLNRIDISSYNLSNNSGNGWTYGLGITGACCGTSQQGPFFAFGTDITISSTGNGAGPAGSSVYVGSRFGFNASTIAPMASAGVFGGNDDIALLNGATGWGDLISHEADNSVHAGASVLRKVGYAVVNGLNDAVQGTNIDAGFYFSGNTGTVGWKNGILLDSSSCGCTPLSTTGTLIGMLGAATFANGLDLHLATISSKFLLGPSSTFSVDGSGNTIAGGTLLVGSTSQTFDSNGKLWVAAATNDNFEVRGHADLSDGVLLEALNSARDAAKGLELVGTPMLLSTTTMTITAATMAFSSITTLTMNGTSAVSCPAGVTAGTVTVLFGIVTHC